MKRPPIFHSPDDVRLRTGELIAYNFGEAGWLYIAHQASMRYVLALNDLFAIRGFRWKMSLRKGKLYLGGMREIKPGEWFAY